MKHLKLIILILTSINLTSCKIQNDKALITSFVEDVIIAENYNYNNLENFIAFGNKIQNDPIIKEQTISFIEIMGKKIHQILLKNEYEILSHQEVLSRNIETKLVYSDYKNVYYLIIDNKKITPFIIDNNKLIACFYKPRKKKNPKHIYPLLFNKEYN